MFNMVFMSGIKNVGKKHIVLKCNITEKGMQIRMKCTSPMYAFKGMQSLPMHLLVTLSMKVVNMDVVKNFDVIPSEKKSIIILALTKPSLVIGTRSIEKFDTTNK